MVVSSACGSCWRASSRKPQVLLRLRREARGFPEARELSLNLAPMIEVHALTWIPNPSPDLSNGWKWSVWNTDAPWSQERSPIKHAGDKGLHFWLFPKHSILETCQPMWQTPRHFWVWGARIYTVWGHPSWKYWIWGGQWVSLITCCLLLQHLLLNGAGMAGHIFLKNCYDKLIKKRSWRSSAQSWSRYDLTSLFLTCVLLDFGHPQPRAVWIFSC